MKNGNSYITKDTHGVLRVGKTPISLDSVVIAFQHGQSAEEIQRNFPALTLEQVYGSIAHYLGHRQQIDAYLHLQRATYARFRRESRKTSSAAVERLRNLRAGEAGTVR